MDKQTIQERIKELRELKEEVSTSDLQGICGAIAIDLNTTKDFHKEMAISELLLNYAYGEIDLNKCLGELGLK